MRAEDLHLPIPQVIDVGNTLSYGDVEVLRVFSAEVGRQDLASADWKAEGSSIPSVPAKPERAARSGDVAGECELGDLPLGLLGVVGPSMSLALSGRRRWWRPGGGESGNDARVR